MKLKNHRFLIVLILILLCFGRAALGETSGACPKVILDCDMGTMNDDMLALSLLLKAEEAGQIDLLGITLEGGNNFISADYENFGALQIDQQSCTADFLACVNREEIPCFGGTDYPIGYEADNLESLAAFYDDLTYLQDGDTYGAVHYFQDFIGALQDSNDARDFLISSADRYPGQIVIIAIGPTMNLARAVEEDDSFAEKIAAIYYMGGAFGEPYDAFDGQSAPVMAIGGAGITPYAEYNACYDAASFEICLTAGFPVQIILPGEVNVEIDQEIVDQLDAANTGNDLYADLWLESYSSYIQDYPYWDPIAVAAFLEPENMQAEEYYVSVNTDRNDERYAMTSAIDEDGYAHLSDAEKSQYGKAFVISEYDDFWDYAIELLCE